MGLGWVTRHSPNLRYEHLCNDKFMVVVAEGHPWARRRVVELSELHRQRLLQLLDTYVMRRMTDEICRNHRVRPRTVAEINSIETLLRSLEPLKAVALMPQVSLRGAENLRLKAIHLEGRDLGLEIGLLRLIDSGDEQHGGSIHQVRQNGHPENDRRKRSLTAKHRGGLERPPTSPGIPSGFKSTLGKPLR